MASTTFPNIQSNTAGAVPVYVTNSGSVGSNVTVTNFPGTQAVSGTVTVANQGSVGSNVVITSGTITTITNAVTLGAGSAQIGTVALAGGTIAATGTVGVNNFPATQAVSGSVAVTTLPAIPTGANTIGTVGVNNFPTTQAISGTLTGIMNGVTLAAGGAVIGGVTLSGTPTVTISNFPTLQAISGAVSVTNLPNTQAVAGTITVGTALPTGSATIGNVGLVQSGTAVSATNPIPQVISPSSLSSYGISAIVSSALESAHVLKTSAGNLYSLNVTSSVSGYLITLNATSVPATTSTITPIQFVSVPSGQTVSISFGSGPPEYYSTGIVALFSTTGPFTYTASATAFFNGHVQ